MYEINCIDSNERYYGQSHRISKIQYSEHLVHINYGRKVARHIWGSLKLIKHSTNRRLLESYESLEITNGDYLMINENSSIS